MGLRLGAYSGGLYNTLVLSEFLKVYVFNSLNRILSEISCYSANEITPNKPPGKLAG